MTVSRFLGDSILARLGNRTVLTASGFIALSGLCILLLAPAAWIALVGFVFVGLGAGNIVPILFRLAGAQNTMPKSLAVAALTTAGYAGMLVGPAAVGFLSNGMGLHNAFWLMAILMACVPVFGKRVTAANPRGTNW